MPDDENIPTESTAQPDHQHPENQTCAASEPQPPAADTTAPQKDNPFDSANDAALQSVSSKKSASTLSTASWKELNSIDETAAQLGTESSAELIAPVNPPSSLAGAPEALQQAQPADGIEILVKLAESGEIDPKNVDIIDVTDKFLKAVAAAPKENLRQSGKILFHACVLLRMKAEALLANEDLHPGDDFLDFDEESGSIIYDSQNRNVGRQITLQDLERALVRKANNRQNRQRRVTLDQLIEALREAEKIEKIRAERQPRTPRIELAGYHEVNDVNDILDLAHDEDIETTIDRVEMILTNFLEDGEAMQLFHIIRLLDRHGDWVDAFLAVLFLSNAGKITLEQEEFYGPLYIRGAQGIEQAGQAAC